MMFSIVNLSLMAASFAVLAPGSKVLANSLEARDVTLNCGIFATGLRSSAQTLQQQLAQCDESVWGTNFTVFGTDDVKKGAPSPCLALACDYVSTKDFHHTQFQLCNDNPHAVSKNCSEIAYWTQYLIDNCCTSGDGLSGQVFLGDGTNIDVSYSAACHSAERPSDPGAGMGSCSSA